MAIRVASAHRKISKEADGVPPIDLLEEERTVTYSGMLENYAREKLMIEKMGYGDIIMVRGTTG